MSEETGEDWHDDIFEETDEEIASRIERECEDDTDPRIDKPMSRLQQMESYGLMEDFARMILIIGDDPSREGLKDSPERIVRSWDELYAGYEVDVPLLFTVFDNEQYDEMVILRNIQFHSMCEHHFLPFSGKACVAYIPDTKIVGISKLERVVHAYARRLQNQERITTQVTQALMDYLQPKGAACVLSAHHYCMGCRGVNDPGAQMVTSSLTGVFKDDPSTRREFLELAKGQ